MKVREVMKLLIADGWYYVNTEGSHRQYKHPVKRGRVTVAGHLADDLHPLHVQGMIKDREPIPALHTSAEYIDVPLPHSAA
jgi:predicted RNA binding protein YcfA (HicA-like mRNA interferase family)